MILEFRHLVVQKWNYSQNKIRIFLYGNGICSRSDFCWIRKCQHTMHSFHILSEFLFDREKKKINFCDFFLHKMLTIFAKQLSWISIFYKLHSYITMEIISRYLHTFGFCKNRRQLCKTLLSSYVIYRSEPKKSPYACSMRNACSAMLSELKMRK